MDIRDEIEDLAMNFEACHKTLAAMGDETRQRIILEMISRLLPCRTSLMIM